MQSKQRDHAEALYYHIAGDAIGCAQKESDEFRWAQYVCTSMVFSALTLEAYINQQYASCPETTKLVDLLKLDIRAKWRMLPLLLGGPETFDSGTMPYQAFHELVCLRNQVLVHFKPVAGALQPAARGRRGLAHKTRATDRGQQGRQPFSEIVKGRDKAKSYFECIAAIRRLSELTAGRTDVPEFLNGARYLSTFLIDVTFSMGLEFDES